MSASTIESQKLAIDGGSKTVTNKLVQDYHSEDASTTLLELDSGTQATVDCFFCIPDEANSPRIHR